MPASRITRNGSLSFASVQPAQASVSGNLIANNANLHRKEYVGENYNLSYDTTIVHVPVHDCDGSAAVLADGRTSLAAATSFCGRRPAYKVVRVPEPWKGDSIQASLDQAAQDGWQLVAPIPQVSSGNNTLFLILKK